MGILNGDFPTRQLRNMLAGNMPMFVIPLLEYPGISDMIEMISKTSALWNRDIAFAEMTKHEFLSKDLNLQSSEFSNGAKIIVNFALSDNKLPDGKVVRGYGFLMKFSNGAIKEGSFKTSVVLY